MQPTKRRRLEGNDPSDVLSSAGLELLSRPLEAIWSYRDCRYNREPFPSVEIDEFFDRVYLGRVREQLLQRTKYTPRSSDLFSYSGTDDLVDPAVVPPTSPLASLRDCIYSDAVMQFFGALLNVRLSVDARPDLSSHIYRTGDFLACHDDDMRDDENGRRIAFILYLTEKWTEADGGALCLYDVDHNGYPRAAEHHIWPRFGRLALFEVSPISYHEVSEVLGKEDRLSISGWFRGPLRYRAQISPLTSVFAPRSDKLSRLLRDGIIGDGFAEAQRQCFATEGYLAIDNFFTEDAFETVSAEAAAVLERGFKVGPASARRYCIALRSPTLELFRSESFRGLLQSWTGHEIQAHRVMFRAFGSGDYTLLHDQIQDPSGLDVLLGLQPSRADVMGDRTSGGSVRYVLDARKSESASVDNDLLLSIPPLRNTLTIVSRDSDTLKFVERVRSNSSTGWKRVDMEGVAELLPEEI